MRLSALAVCLAVADPAQAIDPQTAPQFRSVPVPRGVVAALQQDSQGFLWVGTGNGLARWDGHHLLPVERAADTAARRSLGWIRALAPGPQGRLWIGTEVDGLALYDPATATVNDLGSADSGHPRPTVHALLAEGDGVWMGSLGGDLQHYQPGRGFRRVPTPDPRILALQRDPEGSLWIGHWSGLARLPVGAPRAEAHTATSSPVSALLALADGRMWVGLKSGDLGLLTPWTGAWTWFKPEGRGGISSLQLDRDGQLWVGHSLGIEVLEAATGRTVRRLRPSPSAPGGLAGEQVTALMRDATGAMWVGGFGLGLQRQVDSAALQMRGPDEDGPLRHLDARALLARPSARTGTDLLVALHGGGVVRLDGALHPQGMLPHEGRLPVTALAHDAQQRLWLADATTLWCQTSRGARCGRWPLPGGSLNRLVPVPDGSLWLAGQAGLHRLASPTAGSPVPVRDTDGRPLVGEAFAVTVDAAGAVWVGTAQGLWRGALGSDRVSRVVDAPREGLGSPVVIGLRVGRDGTLWLDTSVGGLHRLLGFDAEGRARYDRVSERHGAAGRPFGANLQEDADGRIWTQAFVYTPATDRLEDLHEADALPLGTPWFYAEAALPDGRLVFGGSRGLLVVHPRRHGVAQRPPTLRVSALRVNETPHPVPLDEAPLRVPPQARSLSVSFAALHHPAPERLRFRYRLEGLETAWRDTDASRRVASYGELPPGSYALRVQVGSAQGDWAQPDLRLPIEVDRAWWQHPVVRGAGVVAAAAGVWMLGTWRVRRLRRRGDALEALVAERTQALRDAALTDPLTGLRNRRFLTERIESDLRRNERRQPSPTPGEDVLVFLIDLDHFKAINDGAGHAAGDAVLQQVAERLQQVFRGGDLVVRWGGEEFLAVAHGSRRQAAGELAERVRRALADVPMALGPQGPSRTVTASIGFAAYPPDRERPTAWSWEQVVQLADAALYAAKAEGRNTWVGITAAAAVAPGPQAFDATVDHDVSALRAAGYEVLQAERRA